MLAAARSRLTRVTPDQAFAEARGDAVLIDIRPAAQRAAVGEIPGSVVIERNHLEWRLDPASDARLPWVSGYDLRPIVICMEGYTSSLAAAALQDLGLDRATDVAGGYQAWRQAGLPTARPDERSVEIAPGAGPAFLLGQAGRAGGDPRRADDHHDDGHEDEPGGDGRLGYLVGECPGNDRAGEPVRGAVGEGRPRGDDDGPEKRVG